MDQLVVRFSMLPGLTWSDGAPLTVDDSIYSYQVAKSLFSPGQYSRLDRTASYLKIDGDRAEWRGLPGYKDSLFTANFFSPLPQHLWAGIPADQLPQGEQVSHRPLGWGAYIVEDWVTGDHITLNKNPNYFRTSEGLPYFDHLVFRFVRDGAEALDALTAGECDLIDPSAALELDIPTLENYQEQGRLVISYQHDTAWEMVAFGIDSINPERVPRLAQAQVRQAIAMCVDRESMASDLMFGQASVPNSYVPSSHPLYAPDLPQYDYDPGSAVELLTSAGWIDDDNDPGTPRVSLGVPGVIDGTPLTLSYYTSSDAERPTTAQMLQNSLANCGISVDVITQEPGEFLAAGPEGPVFGRDFDMAQFALPTTLTPPCYLFESDEIPGPYPVFSLGWSGLNITGYQNSDFDRACQTARTTLAESPAYRDAHYTAQQLFARDLPVLPLYTRFKVIASLPSLCNLGVESAFDQALWNIEMITSAPVCAP